MRDEILKCTTTYFLDGEAPLKESLQTTIVEAIEAASVTFGVADAVDGVGGRL
jgi:hypothetical protein